MIDEFMCRRAERSRSGYSCDPDYNPNQALQYVEFLGSLEGQILWVICPPWLGGGKLVTHLTNNLTTSGSVMRPHFHDQIIEPNVKQVQESYKYIQDWSVEKVNNLAASFEEVRLAVLSLGHAMLFLVAPHLDKLTRVDSAVGGASLADSLWHGIRTQPIRRQFEKDNITFEEIRPAWQDIGIENNAHGFRGIEINMQTSANDNIIPSSHQLELRQRFEQAGAHVKHKQNRTGHYATAARFCLARH